MDRAEKTGLGLAFAGHVILFGMLSVGFLATPNPLKLRSDPVEVQFVDEVGLKSAFPKPATEEPAQSAAPETGKPEDSAPPEPQPIEPVPAPPAPKPAPAPSPDVKKVAPLPDKPQPAKPAPKPVPTKAPVKATGSEASAKPEQLRGSLLGADFRKGLAASAREQAKGQTPRAAVVGAQALSSLGSAIARQIRPCYDLGPLGGTSAMDIVVKVRLQPDKSGVVTRDRLQIVGFTGISGSNGMYQARMAEVARNAVLNPRCSPLQLPAELYSGGWEDIVINFIPRQLG